ncbi:response regulator transcription factor [Anaerocolumna sp. MB42-C2]|uniref:response regulator transcription factor n=1 Tax=Anaerocolumna sp. MB42-C2 TaxID=3070997 RepID=UPI0027E10107|nr:response regulator [Anaerocolumna sp. MB42-C2]WMJ86277.1 response regulator [Anaerocolumna sp. MB42-C2]
MRVLIVDDEPYMIEYIKKLVDWRNYGFCQVLTAKGGSMARDLLLEYRPELLVTDIKMPKLSGLDLSRIIKENHYPTKVVIISGYSEFEYAKQAIRYGVSEYLVKPVLKNDFEESLERVLEKSFDRQAGVENREGVTNNQADVIYCIKKYIGVNYDKNLSLDALGELVHLHPAYLSKIFKEATDVNLSNYIMEVRMQKAAQLLEQTELQIRKVMEQVGYQKSQYFSKLFKDKYGVTPKEYRRIKQK